MLVHTVSMAEYFLAPHKSYKTEFVNLFSINTGLILFSLAIRETSTMFDININISLFVSIISLLCSHMSDLPWKRIAAWSVQKFWQNLVLTPKKYSQSNSCNCWQFHGRFWWKKSVTEFVFIKFQTYSL